MIEPWCCSTWHVEGIDGDFSPDAGGDPMRWRQIVLPCRGLLITLFIVTAIVLPLAPIVRAGPSVRVYTEVITLRSYDWRSALQPTKPGDPIYPYPRLDFDRVGPPRPVTSTVVPERAGTR
jgi:hypothetical protein